MAYNGQQRSLLLAADKYAKLGYKVGLCQGKVFLSEHLYGSLSETSSFDGISILPEGIVCVDIDVPDFSMIDDPLPPTWKERTPRGYHLFYKINLGTSAIESYQPKIKWRKSVDLLTKSKSLTRRKVSYGSSSIEAPPTWGEHVISSPTDGYTLIYPDEIPAKDKLTPAPTWLLDALREP